MRKNAFDTNHLDFIVLDLILFYFVGKKKKGHRNWTKFNHQNPELNTHCSETSISMFHFRLMN